MKKQVSVVVVAAVVCGAFLAGAWYQKRQTGADKSGGRAVLYYVDPMHPSYRSDKPGTAPDCGMKLEPVYTDGGGPDPGAAGEFPSLPPGAVKISPDRQQLIGVKIATVEKKSGARTFRMFGRVSVDETRIYRILAAADGWIRETCPNSAGSLVKKDEILASYYSPEFLSAQQAYIFALNALSRFQATGKETESQIQLTNANIQQYRDSLSNLGMSEMQIDEIARNRKLTQKIHIVSPASGFIISRNVSLNQRFDKGTEFYKVADLSHVWILADIFENEAQYLKPGVTARVAAPNLNRTFYAKVSDILPQFDPVSRTLKVRLEADNPGYVLRPDMFVDVELPVSLPPAVSVPVDAVLDSGLKKTIFVERGNGFFEPRKVETGWRFGDLVEIVSGLTPGERIVVSGNFLLDSESRMKVPAAKTVPATAADPSCGHVVDTVKARKAGLMSTYQEKTYYFWSSECKQQFDKDPALVLAQYAQRRNANMNGEKKTLGTTATDIVCGYSVDSDKAATFGRMSTYRGKAYYFCSVECKQQFDNDPDRVLVQSASGRTVKMSAEEHSRHMGDRHNQDGPHHHD